MLASCSSLLSSDWFGLGRVSDHFDLGRVILIDLKPDLTYDPIIFFNEICIFLFYLNLENKILKDLFGAL
jgi:hypothetical protein